MVPDFFLMALVALYVTLSSIDIVQSLRTQRKLAWKYQVHPSRQGSLEASRSAAVGMLDGGPSEAAFNVSRRASRSVGRSGPSHLRIESIAAPSITWAKTRPKPRVLVPAASAEDDAGPSELPQWAALVVDNVTGSTPTPTMRRGPAARVWSGRAKPGGDGDGEAPDAGQSSASAPLPAPPPEIASSAILDNEHRSDATPGDATGGDDQQQVWSSAPQTLVPTGTQSPTLGSADRSDSPPPGAAPVPSLSAPGPVAEGYEGQPGSGRGWASEPDDHDDPQLLEMEIAEAKRKQAALGNGPLELGVVGGAGAVVRAAQQRLRVGKPSASAR